MSNTVIIIPSRLKAERLPNKPLKLIRNKEMILHVYDLAVKSKVGEVLLVTPDNEIAELIKKNGGNSFVSKGNHETGTDRVFEAFKTFYSSKPKIIINLQGDMPNLNPDAISYLGQHLNKGLCDVATLASSLKKNTEIHDRNITTGHNDSAYHHIGIYGFTNKALIKYVNLKRSKLELERDLEQMRALENNMKIHVGLVNSIPLSVDTEEDLQEIKKLVEKNDKN